MWKEEGNTYWGQLKVESLLKGDFESVNVQLSSCSALQGKGLKERKYLEEET